MIDSISWCNPGISFSKDGLPLFERWGPFKIDNFEAACEQKSSLVIDVLLYRICYTNKTDKPRQLELLTSGWSYVSFSNAFFFFSRSRCWNWTSCIFLLIFFSTSFFFEVKASTPYLYSHLILFFVWCLLNLQVCHLFPLTMFEACSKLKFLFCGLFYFRFPFLIQVPSYHLQLQLHHWLH